ncbi:MAG: hypothetical protein ACJ8FT_06355 [Sphingomonas sp.]
MILRFLNIQGLAGIAAALTLAVLLVIQKVETRHWKKLSVTFEQRYDREHLAFGQTVVNYRAAAAAARAADQANARVVAAEQRAINERTADDYQARLAAARAYAGGLRGQPAAADPRARGNASMPSVSAAPGGAAEAAREDGLPQPDALTATEQAIQLDELIKWVRQQAAIDTNRSSPSTASHDR